jgi:hypothetical protein
MDWGGGRALADFVAPDDFAEVPQTVGEHGDRRLGAVSLVPAGPGVMVARSISDPAPLIDRPEAALPDERARRLVIDGQARVPSPDAHR